MYYTMKIRIPIHLTGMSWTVRPLCLCFVAQIGQVRMVHLLEELQKSEADIILLQEAGKKHVYLSMGK